MTTTYSVLHIDDDPATTRFITSMLRKRGIEAAELNDPSIALEELMLHDYRVVLLDIDMPGIDGLDLLKQIKQRDGGISVIMLTGLVSQTSVLKSMRYGALACLFKPLKDIQPLLDALATAFDSTTRWWATVEELSEMRREHSMGPQLVRAQEHLT